jgi:hypothetical protein
MARNHWTNATLLEWKSVPAVTELWYRQRPHGRPCGYRSSTPDHGHILGTESHRASAVVQRLGTGFLGAESLLPLQQIHRFSFHLDSSNCMIHIESDMGC